MHNDDKDWVRVPSNYDITCLVRVDNEFESIHHSDDIMMIKTLMKSREICPIVFAQFPEVNVVAIHNKFEIRSIAPCYHMNVVALNNMFERIQMIKCMNRAWREIK